ncbi:hypothetical protein ACI2IX_11060 [Leifsonia aquatica]|uniref:hypothetical protein n=1 Tax=Leifsonia aquatica TaxID=144185 RepID=UPI00384EEDC3
MSDHLPVVLIETRGDVPAGHFGSTLVALLQCDPDGVQCVVPNGLDARYLRQGISNDQLHKPTVWTARLFHRIGVTARFCARRSLVSPLARRSHTARSFMHAAVRMSYALDEAAGLREALHIAPGSVAVVMTAEPRLGRFVEAISRVGHLRYLHEADEQPNLFVERFALLSARLPRTRTGCRVLVPHPALIAAAACSESVPVVGYAPFAVAPSMDALRRGTRTIRGDGRQASPIRVLLIGRLWAHKQCERTLDGVRAAFPDGAEVIALAGLSRLREEAMARGVPLVTLDADCLTEEELDRQIVDADVIVVERQRGVRRESGSVIRCLGAPTPVVLISDDPFLHAEFRAVQGVYPIAPDSDHELAAALIAAVTSPTAHEERRPFRYRAAARLESFRRSKQEYEL